MRDTREEFAKKDAEYFDLVGRHVGHGEWIAKIISYRPASGPRYIFELQYESGPKRGEEVEVQRHEFYVLPLSDIEDKRREMANQLRAVQEKGRNYQGLFELHESTLLDLIAVLEGAEG